jgi:myo-inositol-1(or 4)-monophosphatase
MLDLDWLGAMRRAAAGQKRLFDAELTIAGRTVYEGVGEGGDHSLALDRRCEDIVFAELERLHPDAPEGFVAISEERGDVAFGDPGSPWRVVIDPIDGSLNTRRTIPSHALSVAVASGPSMADVEWGFVHEFGTGDEFVATRGAGAELNGRELRAEGPGYGLEIVGLESADPARIAPVVAALVGQAYRVRVIGSIAITLCYVAAGRLDAMLSARGCRSVDAAAGQLIVREAGGEAAFAGLDLDQASLDLDARYAVLAALDTEMLATVREAQARSPEAA